MSSDTKIRLILSEHKDDDAVNGGQRGSTVVRDGQRKSTKVAKGSVISCMFLLLFFDSL